MPQALNHTRHLILAVALLALTTALVACGPSPTAEPKLVEKVHQEVAHILKKDVSQVDIRKPLGAQGADELDIVEIIMAVEEAFKVAIPDSALGEKPNEIAKTLTIQKLADIVAGQIGKKSRSRP